MNKTENTPPSADEDKITELRLLIREELRDCSHQTWPNVCHMQSTELGRTKLEDMIIRYVAEEAMPIGSAIAHIETELAHDEEAQADGAGL